MTKTEEADMQSENVQKCTDASVVYRRETDFSLHVPELAASTLSASEFPEVCLIADGSGIHRILEQAIPCRAGEVYVVAPSTPHAFYRMDSDTPLTVHRLRFDPASLLGQDASKEESPHYCYGVFAENPLSAYAMLNAETHAEIKALLDAISRELETSLPNRQAALGAHITLLLISLSRYVGRAIKNLSSLSSKDRALASLALHFVSQECGNRELTLERIAKELYVSQSHLSRIFQRMTGESFSSYLRTLRLARACELLGDTTMTVDSIVESCGLRDLPSFYHAFRAYTGMTPHQYRTQQMSIQNQRQLGEKIMSILNEMSENLQKGKAKLVKELVEKAIAEGCDPTDILNEGLLGAMSIIGEKFKNNEVYVPEVLVAARAMNMGVSVLKPYLVETGITATGKVCIGTVQGDLHDIGKNLVRMMLESKGLEVIDLGVDVPAERFVQTAIDEGCQVICCSALLTTTMSVMETVVQKAEEAGIRDKVKIMIGGAPVNEEFREKIGADCYTTDAASAADAAAAFCREA